jgi:undecaprenyl-diphosphatase
MSALTYPEAIFIGLLQGVSELFPVSSLGHSVLVPALIGGQWGRDLNMSVPNSPYLDVLVAMHVATAAALVIFFWRDWVRIVKGLISAIRYRSVAHPDERLAVLLVVATIPVGLAGVVLDKVVREDLGRPVPAAIFLALNGAVLFAVERMQRNRADDEEFLNALRRPPSSEDETMVIPAVSPTEDTVQLSAITTEQEIDARLAKLGWGEAIAIGACQILALLPGISRSGITMVGGLTRGLKHEDAARFAFLLATPVIAGAGLFKLPDLAKPEAAGSVGPAVVGSVLAGLGAYFSVRFLVKYFETRTLTPFAIYCLIGGIGSLAVFGLGLR